MTRIHVSLIALILMAAPLPANAASDWAASGWAADPIWDDGQAEVSVYASERVVYGETRTFDTTLIVVKEDFNEAYTVKADWPFDGKRTYPVLKMNLVQEIPAGHYAYRYLASVFVDKADPRKLVKLAVSSQEWCGTTFKVWKPGDPGDNFRWHSYWDGEGDGAARIEPAADAFAEDQLLVTLRAMADKPLPTSVRILPSALHTRRGAVEYVEGAFSDGGTRAIRAAGRDYACREIILTLPQGRNRYYLDTVFPHVLVRFDRHDGQTLTLKETGRKVYW